MAFTRDLSAGTPDVLKHQVGSYLLPIPPGTSGDASNTADFYSPIIFQFIPEILTDQEAADFEEVGGDSIGRAEPFNMYKGGRGRQLTIAANFAVISKSRNITRIEGIETGHPEISSETIDHYWVQQRIYRLKALTRPIYDRNKNDNTFSAPPLCLFTLGTRYVNLPVIIKDVNVTEVDEARSDQFTGLPEVVRIEIQMQTNYPYGYIPGYLNYINLYPRNSTSQNRLGVFSNLAYNNTEAISQSSDYLSDLERAFGSGISFNQGNLQIRNVS